MATDGPHLVDDMVGARAVARALAERAEAVVEALLGPPSKVSRHEQRWGKRGSVAVQLLGPRRGFWFDHERGEGGDLLHLIARQKNIRLSEAITIAEGEFLGGRMGKFPLPTGQLVLAAADDVEGRKRAALRIWSEAAPINSTVAETYFLRHRGLDVTGLDLRHALRWHAGVGAIIALMTDAVMGEPIGIHRTFLRRDGVKVARKMLGRQGVIRLSRMKTCSQVSASRKALKMVLLFCCRIGALSGLQQALELSPDFRCLTTSRR